MHNPSTPSDQSCHCYSVTSTSPMREGLVGLCVFTTGLIVISLVLIGVVWLVRKVFH